MLPTEIVIHEVKGNAVRVILNFLGEGIRQASEPAHRHPHGQVVALNVTGRDVSSVWLARNL